MYECGDVLLKASESRSEEGGSLVMINDRGGESVRDCLIKRINSMGLPMEGQEKWF